jgi:hypothetical protein
MTGSGYGPPPESGQGGYAQQPQYGQQPPYGQQPYGQPQYGQPPAEYGRHAPNPYGRSPVTYEFGVVGTVTAAIGAILVVIAFTAVNWGKRGGTKFGDIGRELDDAGAAASGLAKAYFGWLGWLLLVVTIVLCVAACAPSPASQALRAFGAIAAAVSIAVTFFAIRLGVNDAYSDDIKSVRIGFYFTIAGFLLLGIGALIGPRRREG